MLHVADRALANEPRVRDAGLLASALARPWAAAFGADAYPDSDAKAAALLHSLARNHPLVDGNKRLVLAGRIAFYGVNGRRLTLSNDEAYDLVIPVSDGTLDAVEQIAARLGRARNHGRDVRSPGPGSACRGDDRELLSLAYHDGGRWARLEAEN